MRIITGIIMMRGFGEENEDELRGEEHPVVPAMHLDGKSLLQHWVTHELSREQKSPTSLLKGME